MTRRLLIIYAMLWALAAGYALYMGNVVRVGSEFSGLPLLLLALPWSLVFRTFRLSLLSSAFNNAVVLMTAYVALNMLILLALSRVMGRVGRR